MSESLIWLWLWLQQNAQTPVPWQTPAYFCLWLLYYFWIVKSFSQIKHIACLVPSVQLQPHQYCYEKFSTRYFAVLFSSGTLSPCWLVILFSMVWLYVYEGHIFLVIFRWIHPVDHYFLLWMDYQSSWLVIVFLGEMVAKTCRSCYLCHLALVLSWRSES